MVYEVLLATIKLDSSVRGAKAPEVVARLSYRSTVCGPRDDVDVVDVRVIRRLATAPIELYLGNLPRADCFIPRAGGPVRSVAGRCRWDGRLSPGLTD
jgi:hypothetical protein